MDVSWLLIVALGFMPILSHVNLDLIVNLFTVHNQIFPQKWVLEPGIFHVDWFGAIVRSNVN